MLKNYFKIAILNLFKSKGKTLVTILGLSAAITCSLLILLYVSFELTYDKSNKNHRSIYRVLAGRTANTSAKPVATLPSALSAEIAGNFPQIAESARLFTMDNPAPLISSGNKKFYEDKFYFCDAGLLTIFDLVFLRGNGKNALNNDNSVVITDRVATKYFGTEDPLGKIISFDEHLHFVVSAVVKSPDANSSLQFDFLANFSSVYKWLGNEYVDDWNNFMCNIYVLTNGQPATKRLENEVTEFVKAQLGETCPVSNVYFQSLDRLHLYSRQDYNISSTGDIRDVYIYSLIAVFILLIAVINFINLSIARSIHRMKEIGIRKAIGASRRQLMGQFIFESMLLIFLSLIIATLMTELILPVFNNIINKELSFSIFSPYQVILLFLLFWMLLSLIAASFPAFFLSSLKPAMVFKGYFKLPHTRLSPGNLLMMVQFFVTSILIISSITVYRQLHYVHNKDLGLSTGNKIIIPVKDQNLRENIGPVKHLLEQESGVGSSCGVSLFPGGPVGKAVVKTGKNEDEHLFSMLWVDADFVKCFGINILAGRDFFKESARDSSEALIINEVAVKELGFVNNEDAIGKSIELKNNRKGKIIAVVKNFHFSSLANPIEPVVIYLWPWIDYVVVSTGPGKQNDVLAFLKENWASVDKYHPFEYELMNDRFSRMYFSEQRFGQISVYFTIIAILIAGFGLFSIVAYTLAKQSKEIGIRKLLGATVTNLILKYYKKYTTLILISNLIAWPVAYYYMAQWLNKFAYRIHIAITDFLLVGMITILIMIVTISYQVYLSSSQSPIDAIKAE